MIIERYVATSGTEWLSVMAQGWDSAPRGYLATAGHTFGVHDLGGCCAAADVKGPSSTQHMFPLTKNIL